MMMNKFIFSFLLLIPFNAFAWSCLQQTPLGENELNVLQMASTKTQNFCLLLKKQDDGVTLKYQVQKIDILNNQNKKIVQSIGLKDTDFVSMEPNQILNVDDYNFDGSPDISLPTSDGGIGPNNINAFFIFDPKEHKYNLNKFLSELSQPVLNKKEKYIESSFRDGCCSRYTERYKVQGNNFVKIYTKTENLTDDGKYIESSVGTLVKGHFKYKVNKIKAPKD